MGEQENLTQAITQEMLKLFDELKSTTKRTEKIEIIRRGCENSLFKKTLQFLLDPNITTGISSKRIIGEMKDESPCRLAVHWSFSHEEILDYLVENNTGKNIDVSITSDFIQKQPEGYQEFYTKLLSKELKLGCDAKTVNVAIPNLIPTFDVMLGTPIDKCKIKDGEEIFISQKMNGTRCIYFDGKLYSRQGKLYKNLDHIINAIDVLDLTTWVLDGELIYKNDDRALSDSEAFQKGTGLANSDEEDKTMLRFVIFDIITEEDFINKKSSTIYSERVVSMDQIREILSSCPLKDDLDVVKQIYRGTDKTMIDHWLDYAEENDWEGIMINLDAPYECKRTKKLIKVKRFKEIELRCISVNIATSGKYNGIMGSISCKYDDFIIDVGSGFSDEQREYYTRNTNEIENSIVTIKYKEETVNKNGGKSLQFPIFIQCRFDKDVADDEI